MITKSMIYPNDVIGVVAGMGRHSIRPTYTGDPVIFNGGRGGGGGAILTFSHRRMQYGGGAYIRPCPKFPL